MLFILLAKNEHIKNYISKSNVRDAYVAGWGSVRNSECHTGINGPSPFTECKFPFKWKNKVNIKL